MKENLPGDFVIKRIYNRYKFLHTHENSTLSRMMSNFLGSKKRIRGFMLKEFTYQKQPTE